MAVVAPQFVSGRVPYSGTLAGSPCRRPVRALLLTAALAAGLASGGCSFSYQLGSLFDKSDETAADQTGSIATTQEASAKIQPLSEGDLVYARAAASEVLARGGKNSSLPWENPSTGARGTVTPIASAYNQDGFTCQDFIASYLRGSGESWLQGEACRVHHGKWEVRSLKPWKTS